MNVPWESNKPYIVAEIGINHNGDLELAKKLIDVAYAAGCDAVKFQKRTIEIVYSPETLDSVRESPWGTTQRAQKEGLEFGLAEYREIDRYCSDLGIAWTASAWDLPSLDFVQKFDPPFHKVASAMVTHQEFLAAVADMGKPTLISTGMADIAEIDAAVDIFRGKGAPIALMHTVSTYPSPEEHLNLRMIQYLEERYQVPVGYSGHEPSVSPSVVAVALGATIIERHITLDRTMYGSDQAASLEPRGLQDLVSMARKIPIILGNGIKTWAPGEKDVASKLRYWQ